MPRISGGDCVVVEARDEVVVVPGSENLKVERAKSSIGADEDEQGCDRARVNGVDAFEREADGTGRRKGGKEEEK